MLTALPRAAQAADTELALGVGTLGIGPRVAVTLPHGLVARLGASEYTFGRIEGYNNQVLNAQVNLRLDESFRIRNGLVTLERPNPHGVTLLAGIAINLNTIHATSVPKDSQVTLNGVTLPGGNAGVIYTDVRWNRIAPFIGARIASAGRSGLYAEVGTFYQGTASAVFSATGTIAANQKNFQPYYDEETRILKRQLAPVQFYPVAEVGYRVRL